MQLTNEAASTTTMQRTAEPSSVAELMRMAIALYTRPQPNLPPPSTPGWCYSVLCVDHAVPRFMTICGKDPVALRIKAYFLDQPGDFNPGVFSVCLGTPYGVDHGFHFSAHVWKANKGESLLSSKEVLFTIPDNFRISGLDDTPTLTEPTHAPSGRAAPLSLLGTLPATTSKVAKAHITGAQTHTTNGTATVTPIDVFNRAPFNVIAAPWPSVSLSEPRLTILPRASASGYHIELAWAWYPRGDVTPTNRADTIACQHSGMQILCPTVPGGLWQQVDLPVPIGVDSLSSQLKPDPFIGGRPLLFFWTRATPLAGTAFQPSEVLFDILVSAVIHIGM